MTVPAFPQHWEDTACYREVMSPGVCVLCGGRAGNYGARDSNPSLHLVDVVWSLCDECASWRPVDILVYLGPRELTDNTSGEWVLGHPC